MGYRLELWGCIRCYILIGKREEILCQCGFEYTRAYECKYICCRSIMQSVERSRSTWRGVILKTLYTTSMKTKEDNFYILFLVAAVLRIIKGLFKSLTKSRFSIEDMLCIFIYFSATFQYLLPIMIAPLIIKMILN